MSIDFEAEDRARQLAATPRCITCRRQPVARQFAVLCWDCMAALNEKWRAWKERRARPRIVPID